MAYFLSPIGNDQQTDANGNPLVGGKIYTYIAGSSTPTATFTDNSTGTQQANPIILNSLGLPASPIWMASDVSVKFIIRDSADVLIRTIDNIAGINDISSSASEWVASGITPTYVSATSFTMAGDQTPAFQVGRRLLTVNTAGTRYSTIASSVFGALTTVTVVNDSGTLDSGLSAVSYGLVSATNTSLPFGDYFEAQRLLAVPLAMTTGTAASVTSLSLTAGDWDVQGQVGVITVAATNVNSVAGYIDTSVSALSNDKVGIVRENYFAQAINTPSNGTPILNTGVTRIRLASTTTVHLVGHAAFATSTLSMFGAIHARRVR